MKQGIHPDYKKATITCACGSAFETGTTVGDLHVEICSACHPFYTGKQKLVDTARRVEKFEAKSKKTSVAKTGKVTTSKRAKLKAKQSKRKPKAEVELKAA